MIQLKQAAVLIKCEYLEEEISAQNNEEQSASENDVRKDNIFIQIEDVPTKLRGEKRFQIEW